MIAQMQVGTELVTLVDDDRYSQIRAKYELADDFLAAFDFQKLAQGGGKGGQLMGFTADYKYIIKQLNDTDRKTLQAIGAEYVRHVLAADGSLLARVFLVFTWNKKHFMVMNNWMPPPKYGEVEGEDVGFDLKHNYSQYDLKGCDDDKTLKTHGEKVEAVHKRIFFPSMWCGEVFWTEDRKKYFEGKLHAQATKFPVTKEAYDLIMKRITRDVAFLQERNLMDYSLVVSFHALPAKATKTRDSVYKCTSDGGEQPFMGTKGPATFVMYVGIIDFLQDWNCMKVIAEKLKILECNKATIHPKYYGDRFVEYFSDKFDPACPF